MKPEGLEHVKGAIRTIEAEAQRQKHRDSGAAADAEEKEAAKGGASNLHLLQHLQDKGVKNMQHKATKATQNPVVHHGKAIRSTPGMKQPTNRALNHTKMHSVAKTTM